jgi:uncharacterized RDD family membrane protein YckC
MDPSAPRDPNAPPPQTPEGDAPRPPDQQGGAPPQQGGAPQQQQQSWQSQPGQQQTWQSQSAPPPPAGGGPTATGQPAWVANLTSQQVTPGPAGFFYADVPNRVIAMFIDIIGIFVIYFIVGAITVALFGFGGFIPTTTSLLVQQLLSAAIWAAYFLYTWVNMRGTLGMKVLGLQVGHESDGRTLTYEQAAWRFGLLFGPQIVIGLIAALIPALGILGILSFVVWLIYVMITIAQSPTKQGIHDRYGHSMVVKAGRAAG